MNWFAIAGGAAMLLVGLLALGRQIPSVSRGGGVALILAGLLFLGMAIGTQA